MKKYFEKQIKAGNKVLFLEYVDAFGSCETHACGENDLEEGNALPSNSLFTGYTAGFIPCFKSRYQT